MKKNLLLFAVFFVAFFCFAQEKQIKKITVDDAVSLALENNISLKRSKGNLKTLERAEKYSWNSASPSLSASGNFSLPLDSEKSDNWTLGGSVSLSLRLSPSVYTSVKNAKLNYEQGKLSYDDAVRSVELNVRNAFNQILYAKEYMSLLQRNFETAKQRYTLNQDKYAKGQLSELDLLSAQYSYESMVPTIESSQISLENSISTFKQILGLEQTEQIELAGNLDDFLVSTDFELEYNFEEIPSVKTLNSKIKSAENQLLATRFSAYGPSISASYSIGTSYSASANGTMMGAGGTGSRERSWTKTGNSIGVGVSIPLDGFLPWSSGSMSVENQKQNLEDLHLQLEDKKTSIGIEIQNSSKKIVQAQSQLEMMEKNVTIAQKKYDMTQAAYNHGSKDFLTFQNAADSLMDAKIKLMSQKLTVINAVLALENTLGVPFGSLLNANNK